HVVHLVRARVIELVALEIDLGAAEMLGQPLGEIERARPAHIVLQIAGHLGLEIGIRLGPRIGLLQLEHERHQRLGDETAAIDAEMTALVRPGAERVGLLNRHAVLAMPGGGAPCRAARMKVRIRSTSFSPGARSTPEDTSTPGAPVIASAATTLSGSSPP